MTYGSNIFLTLYYASPNYFKIILNSYIDYNYEIIYYEGTWSKIKKILSADSNDNDNDIVNIDGDLTISGIITGTYLSKNINGYIWLGGPFKGLLIQWGMVLCNNYDNTTNDMYYKEIPTNITTNSDYLYGHTNYSNKFDFKKTTFHSSNQSIFLGWENNTNSNMSVRWIMLSF